MTLLLAKQPRIEVGGHLWKTKPILFVRRTLGSWFNYHQTRRPY
jgi:hypothetical protein